MDSDVILMFVCFGTFLAACLYTSWRGVRPMRREMDRRRAERKMSIERG